MSDKQDRDNWNQVVLLTFVPVWSGALMLSNNLQGGVRYGVSAVLIIALVLAAYKFASIWRTN